MEKLFVLRYGEIALKGNNRHVFVDRQVANVKSVLSGIDAKVTKEHGRIFVSVKKEQEQEAIKRLRKVYGLISFSPADVCELEMEKIVNLAVEQLKTLVAKYGNITFKVETRRPNKGFALKSPEISRLVGAGILKNVRGVKVDVHHPDYTCFVEVRSQAYVYTDIIKAQGGMPYGSAGRGLLLLSGGIDSPVAGHLIAKRGLLIEAVHFHSHPFTSERAYQKVVTLARKLANYTGMINLHSVNLLEIQETIKEHCPSSEMTILSRRAMMRIATKIAEERSLKALVTGESLGQVASQTLEGISVTTDATYLPIFRPLIAMDKSDITIIAKEIDTFETSILPFEDCCTVFLPDRVVTRPEVERIRASEALIAIDELVKKAVNNRTIEQITAVEELSL